MLTRAGELPRYATRSERSGLAVTARDHRVVGYRIPKEWATLTETQRGVRSLAACKRGSRVGFLEGYGAFVCADAGCCLTYYGSHLPFF